MSDEKTKALVVINKPKEGYGPSPTLPVLTLLKELEELLNDKEEYPLG